MFFQRFGKVVDVSLAYDKSNHRPRGFGFVVFAAPEAASMAVGCHSFHGKTVRKLYSFCLFLNSDSHRNLQVEAKHAVPRDVPKFPTGGLSRRIHCDEASRMCQGWEPRLITDPPGLPLQMPAFDRPNSLSNVSSLLMGQQTFFFPRAGSVDTISYHGAPWNSNDSLSTTSSTFDMMTQKIYQTHRSGDDIPARLYTGVGNRIISQSPILGKHLLGSSGSSF